MEEEIMSKIHVWVGYTTQTKKEFSNYFKNDETVENDKEEAHSFCSDLNIDHYDDDLIGVYKSDSNSDLQITLNELPISPDEIAKIYNTCIRVGIIKANALFYYTDAEINILDINKKYNGLTYIGCFNWD